MQTSVEVSKQIAYHDSILYRNDEQTSTLPSRCTMGSTILELVLLLGNAVLVTILIHFFH